MRRACTTSHGGTCAPSRCLPRPTVVAFAQSFHWTDRPRVAAAVRSMLADGGALVHVGASTHQGVDTDERLPHPPRSEIAALVRHHLGERQRAGGSYRPDTFSADRHAEIYRAAGFRGPERHELPERTVIRIAEEVRASVYSLSSSAPHLFGDHLAEFDAELGALLERAAPDGVFSERMRGITADVWR